MHEDDYIVEDDTAEQTASGVKLDKIVMPCLGCGKGVYVNRGSNEELGIFNVFCHGGECEDRNAARM